MRQVVAGKSASFASRMNFRYEFLLKMMNAEEKALADPAVPAGMDSQDRERNMYRVTERELIERSYWHALEQEFLEGLKKEVSSLSAQLATLGLSEEEAAACEKYHEIQERISQNQNAKKKAAQRELAAWTDEHKAAVWGPILASYDKQRELHRKKGQCEEELRRTMDVLWPPDGATSCNIPTVLARRRLMEEYGYVNGGLTYLGRLASEVNEGHPFLMAELFTNQTSSLSPLSARDLLIVLALFIGEGRDENLFTTHSISYLNVSKEIGTVLARMDDVRQDLLRLEKKHGIAYDPKFWDLSTEWLEPISDWVNSEESVSQIAARHELFEGNVQKAIMKLSGLLEEFQAMATMSENVEWLMKL
jgi:superfamily II RNA helicase